MKKALVQYVTNYNSPKRGSEKMKDVKVKIMVKQLEWNISISNLYRYLYIIQ